MSNHQIQIGEFTIDRVSELDLSDIKFSSLFADWDEEKLSDEEYEIPEDTTDYSGELALMSVHTWVIRKPGFTALVDTGIGNDRTRPFTPGFNQLHTNYLDKLKALGVEPTEVNYVFNTHLHVDHVGWNTSLKDGLWEPTFPNATYIMPKTDYDFFHDQENNSDRNKTSFVVQKDSVDPIVDRGLVKFADFDQSEIIEGFSVVPTVGHTAGHSSIILKSQGKVAVFAGDVLHHPVQVYHPEWNSIFDADAENSKSSRLWLLNYAAEQKAVVFTTHFTSTSKGRIDKEGDEFAWEFV